jgi:hypothetical protein
MGANFRFFYQIVKVTRNGNLMVAIATINFPFPFPFPISHKGGGQSRLLPRLSAACFGALAPPHII